MTLKRDARLRRDYLYRKALESRLEASFEKKKKIRTALEAGKTLPHDLKKEAQSMVKEFMYDDAQTEPSTHMDDEYANAGSVPPKLLITTSRDPSSRLLQFAKEMKLIFPNSQRINRGGYVIKELVDACRENDVTDLIILHEHRGNPDGMVVCHLPYGPTAYFTLHNVVLRHDIEEKHPISEAYPHLIFHQFETKLGLRVKQILKHLFPVPKETSQRVMTFANQNDYISFRHHVFQVDPDQPKKIDLKEMGPRFEANIYEIKLGTVDIKEAETEWVYRPYHRNAKTRQLL